MISFCTYMYMYGYLMRLCASSAATCAQRTREPCHGAAKKATSGSAGAPYNARALAEVADIYRFIQDFIFIVQHSIRAYTGKLRRRQGCQGRHVSCSGGAPYN